MTGEKWQQMLTHTDGANPWATAAMGNTERLVKVEMADIRPEGPWSADTDLSVEIGAIEIHLSSMVMNEAADLTDSGLKHPVGGGIADHQPRQDIGMLRKLVAQVIDINIALVIFPVMPWFTTIHQIRPS